MSQELINAITEMRDDDALKITNQLLDAGTAPMDVLDACREAMEVIGWGDDDHDFSGDQTPYGRRSWRRKNR
jgi:methanogenic corrinoid protein MtbC1